MASGLQLLYVVGSVLLGLGEGCDSNDYASSVQTHCDELKNHCSSSIAAAHPEGYDSRRRALCSEGGSCRRFAGCVEEQLKRTACETHPELSKGFVDLSKACTTVRNITGTCKVTCETPAPAATAETIANPGDTLVGGITYSIRKSNSWELLTLVISSTATPSSLRWPTPCARSYGGYEWEVVQPRAQQSHQLVHVLSCGGSRCKIQIPAGIINTTQYHVIARNLSSRCMQENSNSNGDGPNVDQDPSSQCWRDRAASHLLMQGSFGPTRKSIATLSSSMSMDAQGTGTCMDVYIYRGTHIHVCKNI
jgi:hypothetical protein